MSRIVIVVLIKHCDKPADLSTDVTLKEVESEGLFMTKMAHGKVQCTGCCKCGRRLLGYVRGGTFIVLPATRL
jgi:hypothetical protein